MNQYLWLAMSNDQRRKAIELERERAKNKDSDWYDDDLDDLEPAHERQTHE